MEENKNVLKFVCNKDAADFIKNFMSIYMEDDEIYHFNPYFFKRHALNEFEQLSFAGLPDEIKDTVVRMLDTMDNSITKHIWNAAIDAAAKSAKCKIETAKDAKGAEYKRTVLIDSSILKLKK